MNKKNHNNKEKKNNISTKTKIEKELNNLIHSLPNDL